jgi:hypothetical protein
MEKTMEQVRNNHYLGFYKRLPICDPFLGVDFLREMQVHYDMNLVPKMLIEKL